MNVLKIDSQHQLISVCAWCDAGPDSAQTEARWTAHGFRVSHGTCPAHREQLLAEARSSLPTLNPVRKIN